MLPCCVSKEPAVGPSVDDVVQSKLAKAEAGDEEAATPGAPAEPVLGIDVERFAALHDLLRVAHDEVRRLVRTRDIERMWEELDDNGSGKAGGTRGEPPYLPLRVRLGDASFVLPRDAD